MNSELIGILGGLACAAAVIVIFIVGVFIYIAALKAYGKAREILSSLYRRLQNYYIPRSDVKDTQVNQLNVDDFMQSVSSQNDQNTKNKGKQSKLHIPIGNISNTSAEEESGQWTTGYSLPIDNFNSNSVMGANSFSSEYGNAKSIFEMGLRYAIGDGVEQNLRLAKAFILLAASKGYPPAIKIMNKMGF